MRRVAWLTGVVGTALVLLWTALRWDGGLESSTVRNAAVAMVLVVGWSLVYRWPGSPPIRRPLGALQWLTVVVALGVVWWEQTAGVGGFLGRAGYLLLFGSLAFLVWMGLVVFLAHLSRDISSRRVRNGQPRGGHVKAGRARR